MSERKPLNVEDVATLMAIRSKAESYQAAIDALTHMHNTLVENMRTRYNAPEQDGWQLQDYVVGFVQLPHDEHDQHDGHHH